MPYVDGKTLSEFRVDFGMLDKNIKFDIINQIFEGLYVLHNEYHVYHRDIKPDNIMIEIKDGIYRVKILDFGICKMGLNESYVRGGSMLWSAPEQQDNEFVDQSKIDVYCFGLLILWLMYEFKS